MPTVTPPRWTSEQLDAARLEAIDVFRVERMREPLGRYLDAFTETRSVVESLLAQTTDLANLSDQAVDVLTDPALLEAVRYLAGPPISADDLKILATATLSPGRLRREPDMAQRVIDTVLAGLDQQRFPWVRENREPTSPERGAAAMASAALMASRRVMTARANESGEEQEMAVMEALRADGFKEVPSRDIPTLDKGPNFGEFCGESLFGSRKADIVIRLWDGRVMPAECKVSNSSLNSVKRLNNDAAVKAGQWLSEFGTAQTVPAAVIAGVFKLRNLEAAQARGLTLWWAHKLDEMISFIRMTR